MATPTDKYIFVSLKRADPKQIVLQITPRVSNQTTGP